MKSPSDNLFYMQQTIIIDADLSNTYLLILHFQFTAVFQFLPELSRVVHPAAGIQFQRYSHLYPNSIDK